VSELVIIVGKDVSPGFRLGGFDCIELEEGEDVSALIEGIHKDASRSVSWRVSRAT
jgi:vacuolar-type H+-ATPase subunit F/Vma7